MKFVYIALAIFFSVIAVAYLVDMINRAVRGVAIGHLEMVIRAGIIAGLGAAAWFLITLAGLL